MKKKYKMIYSNGGDIITLTFNPRDNRMFKYGEIYSLTDEEYNNFKNYFRLIEEKKPMVEEEIKPIEPEVIKKAFEERIELIKKQEKAEAEETINVSVDVPVAQEPIELDYESMTKKELIELCEERNISSYGNKKELIERLKG